MVRFASEEEAGRGVEVLDGAGLGREGRKLRVERLEGSEVWEGLVNEGKVDESVVEGLECLEIFRSSEGQL